MVNVYYATKTRIYELNLKPNDVLEMEYDFGCSKEFVIEVKKIDKANEENDTPSAYPKIIEGYGKGIIEDILAENLKDIIKKGKTTECFNIYGYKRYKFENYDVKKDNKMLHDRLYKAITAYEEPDYEY